MDFTERMLERNRSRYAKSETKEGTNQNSAPLKEVHHNTVTTIASTSRSNKVTIETTVTMRKVPKRSSDQHNEEVGNDEETSCTEGDSESTDEKENGTSQDRCPLRQNTKSTLQRLGVLYSDDPSRLSSPIHRTEERFLVEEEEPVPRSAKSSARNARLAALAETINHWEDDVRHHSVGEEAQGFCRSESSERLQYNYNKGKSASPTKPPPTANHPNSGSPRNRSPLKAMSPAKATSSPVKPKSPVKVVSPVKGRYGSPIQMGTSVTKARESAVVAPSSDEDVPVPTMGVKQLRSGFVLDQAQRYEESTSPTKRSRDPAELSLAERMALFERNAGGAVLPKAPFGMSVPAKKLQSIGKTKSPNNAKLEKRQPLPQASLQHASGSTSSLHDRLAVFESRNNDCEKDHMKEILSERQKEMEMLKHRWDRYKGEADTSPQDFPPSAPPPSPPPPPPMPSPQHQYELDKRRYSDYYYNEEQEEPHHSSPQSYYYSDEKKDLKHQKTYREENPKHAYPVLKDVKKIKLSPPKPGCIYPCLSDMEVESEAQESDREDIDNNRSTSSSTSTDSDVNSLGQQIVKISRSNLKRDWPSDQSGSEVNEIDDFLDEALEESSDEPTPPKRSSHSHSKDTVHSTSFEYRQSGGDRVEPSQPLLHTVSFYRKQQTMSLKPSSPTRHIHLDPSPYSTDDSIERLEEELDRELKLVEEKIDMLQQEVRKQQTIISQASQALNLCYSTIEFSGSTEQLEAEKLLLLASQRRQAALHEIQRLRVEQTLRPKAPGNKTLTERGSLMLSQITLPLKMDVIHQAAKDDQCYYLVCLVHSDEHVYCTDIMCAPRSLHDHNRLTFPNAITLDGLYSDFKVTLEVYSMTARSKELIPHDVKYHINTNKKDASKLKLTPRKGKGESKLLMPPVQSPGGPMAVRTSAFSMAGYVIFSLREIHRTQFSLNKNAYTSVLEGSLHLKIESEMCMDVEYRGFLTMFEDVSGFGAWHRRWCLLKGDKLSYWKYPDDERKKIALNTIELSSCTTKEVDVVSRDICARPNTFVLDTTRPAQHTDVDSLVLVRNGSMTTIRHMLSADTKEERIQWCHHLNKALALMRAWGVPSSKLYNY